MTMAQNKEAIRSEKVYHRYLF